MDSSEECAHPASAKTGDSQACRIDERGTNLGCTREEREEVYDILEDFVPRARGEQPIVCRDECETRSVSAS